MANDVLRVFRTIHLYFGLLISPALLFFAFTGAMQTFSLHETVQGSSYTPAKWEMELAQIHKKATPELRQRPKPAVDAGAVAGAGKTEGHHDEVVGSAARAGVPVAVTPSGPTERQKHLPLKLFFGLVALGLCTSTLTGVYMAYKYGRNAWVVTAWWVAGVVVPVVLLKLGK